MGSPVSPIVANIYMETFEYRAINTALNPPRIWRRYVDDTFVLQQQSHKQEFFKHINTVDPSIQSTVEEARPDDSIPFLDILVTPKTDGTFTTKVYRKLTHIDLYLQWDSHHNLAAKYSMINTLTYRARTICLLTSELHHLEKVLMQCKYPKWAINKILQKQQHQQKDTTNKRQIPSVQHTKKCHIVIPYSQCICERLRPSTKSIECKYILKVE